MTRIMLLSLIFPLLPLSAAAEERQLQVAVLGEAGTITLRVTLEEGAPPALGNYSSLSPEPEPSFVPELATLGLLGLAVERRICSLQQANVWLMQTIAQGSHSPVHDLTSLL